MMTEQFHHIFQANDMQQYIDRGMDIDGAPQRPTRWPPTGPR